MHCDQASTSLGSDKLTGLFAGNHHEQEKDRRFRHDFLKAQDFGNRVYSEVDLTCFCQAYHRDYTSESLHAVVEAALVATSSYGTFIKDVRLARNAIAHIAECWNEFESLEQAEQKLLLLTEDESDVSRPQDLSSRPVNALSTLHPLGGPTWLLLEITK